MSHIDGYRGLARFMIRDKDQSPCILRRFDELGVRNPLYFQSELLEIEQRLEKLAIAHVQAPLNVKAGLRDWSGTNVEADVDEPNRSQIKERTDLILQLGYVMNKYRMFAACQESCELTPLSRRDARARAQSQSD